MKAPKRKPRWPAVPPRGLRAKLTPDQLQDLGLAHTFNLDDIARGAGTEETLWHWVGGVLTWSRVAVMLDAGVPEMQAQLGLSRRLAERYQRTGRMAFDGPDYQLAKEGLFVMDQLAELVDRHTAIAAANWSERKVNELEAACPRRSQLAA